jgi:hypothetical protein
VWNHRESLNELDLFRIPDVQKSSAYLQEDLPVRVFTRFSFFKSLNCEKLYILLDRYF